MWKPTSSRKPISSFYSIDAPKDTVYLTIDHGKSVAQQAPRERSPSPDFSDMDTESVELKPPVPLKNLKARMQFGRRKQSKTGIPLGYSAKGRDWEPSPSRFSLDSSQMRMADSPELPDPDMGGTLRDELVVPDGQPPSRFSWTTYAPSAHEASQEIDALPDLSSLTFQPQQYAYNMPRSRFSWSTHQSAAEKSVNSTPQPGQMSPPSPPPTPPSPPGSVLTRRRPLPRPDEYGFYPEKQQIKRKPTPSEAAASFAPPSTSNSAYEAKDLPLSPEQVQAADKVAMLQAEVDTLENRRYNLEKVIQGLTALQPSNPVEFDLSKRREAKERIEAFERELADVKRKEHELGLKLHKAIRRRDEQEPTGLWVRRVTG